MLLDSEPGRSRFEGEAYSRLSSIVRREGEMICKGSVVCGLFFLSEAGRGE